MSVIAAATLISAVLSLCEASAFLRPHASVEPEDVTRDRVLQGLLSELAEQDDPARLRELEDELRPMYQALPKGAHGELEPATVRYALHRYFVQKRGWNMKGLEHGSEMNASSAGVQDIFAESLQRHGTGTGLGKLALFASKLTDLVQKEAVKNLENIFMALKFSATSHISKKEAESAFKGYLVMYLLGDSTEDVRREDLVAAEKDLIDMYPAWRSVKLWSKDLDQTLQFMHQPQRNPFVGQEFGFQQSSTMVQKLGERFGSFQKMECMSLKGVLVEMELAGSGRVPLSEFYRVGMKEDWQFNENAEYLRSLGALDESDPHRPSVLIPNYLHSQTNCLSASGFYSVCCSNECENLLGHLEQSIASPSALPSHIAEMVSRLESDTVEAPRNLSSVQLSRLSGIAELHGGRVPLHGRLFAQWMHHAYPRECPFPHVSGSTTALSQEEWHKSTGGEDPLATKEQMQQRLAQLDATVPEQEMHSLPWMEVEELVARPSQTAPGKTASFPSLRLAVCFLVLASSAFPLVHVAKRTAVGMSDVKADRYLV